MPAAERLGLAESWVRRLVARVDGSKRRLVLLQGLAGCGKSALLAVLAERHGVPVRRGAAAAGADAAGLVLVDCGDGSPLPLVGRDPVEIRGAAVKTVLACRPGPAAAEIDRLVAYGCAETIPTGAFFLTPNDAARHGHGSTRALVRSGGWPWLFRHILEGGEDEAVVERVLRAEILGPMAPVDQALVTALVRLRGGLQDGRLTRAERDVLGRMEPLVRLDEAGRWRLAVPGLTAAFRRIAADWPAGQPPQALAGYARNLHAHGAVADAIRMAQLAGDGPRAAAWLAESGGPWFGHFHGAAAFSRVLSGFDEAAQGSEVVALSNVMRALKSGRVDRARTLMAARFGPDALSLDRVLDLDADYSCHLRVFRLVMAIYEQADPDESLVERAYHVLALLPEEDHLQRGLFYNAMIEFYLRQLRLSEARAVARRALHHYRAANSPYLAFFIHLFHAVISLMDGQVEEALKASDACGEALRESGVASAADWRIQKVLRSCIDYERGDPAPLVRFIDQDMESFSFGELWPTLGELCLLYGAQALAQAASPGHAQAFLDRWRVEVARSGRFRTVAALHEIRLQQARNHWNDAAQRLTTLPRVSFRRARTVIDRHELAMLLIHLRQRVYETPLDPAVSAALKAVGENPWLTARQALAVSFWEAFARMRAGQHKAAREIVELNLEKAARRRCVAPVFEERPFLQEVLSNRRIAGQTTLSEPARSLVGRLKTLPLATATADEETGLTRREIRVLRLIAEGCTNKEAARAAGLSVSTVKFHLTNCYRKLGVAERRAAIAVARSRGWCD